MPASVSRKSKQDPILRGVGPSSHLPLSSARDAQDESPSSNTSHSAPSPTSHADDFPPAGSFRCAAGATQGGPAGVFRTCIGEQGPELSAPPLGPDRDGILVEDPSSRGFSLGGSPQAGDSPGGSPSSRGFFWRVPSSREFCPYWLPLHLIRTLRRRTSVLIPTKACYHCMPPSTSQLVAN